MKKFTFAALIVLSFFAATVFMPKEASAVPGFARQTGKACTFCHFQHYPALNEEGRKFKAGGFTDIEGQALVSREGLSLPIVLNASLITSVGYVKTNGDDDPTTPTKDESKIGPNKGQLQFPSEASLMVGGRGGEHVGFLLDLSRVGEDAAMPGGPPAGSIVFSSFKAPIIYDLRGAKLSVIPFTTDMAGVAYGFELLNTGAVTTQRTFVDDTKISAQQYLGTAGAATGVAFVAANDMGFVNVSLWGPSKGAIDTGLDLSQYVRVAATPRIGEWDLGIGGQYWTGETKVGDTTNNPGQVYVTKAWAIDAQAQGEVGSMPCGVYITYGNAAGKDNSAKTTQFNNNPNDKKALSVQAELGVIPKKLTLGLGYRAGDNGAATKSSDNATLVGATYLLAQNVRLELNQTYLSGDAYSPKPTTGNQQTTVMLSAAF